MFFFFSRRRRRILLSTMEYMYVLRDLRLITFAAGRNFNSLVVENHEVFREHSGEMGGKFYASL